MDPDSVKSTLSNLAFGNVMAAAARDYQKVCVCSPLQFTLQFFFFIFFFIRSKFVLLLLYLYLYFVGVFFFFWQIYFNRLEIFEFTWLSKSIKYLYCFTIMGIKSVKVPKII